LIDFELANSLLNILIRPSVFSDYPMYKPFHNFDVSAIQKFREYKSQDVLEMPLNLADTYQDYKAQRLLLNDYHLKIEPEACQSKTMKAAAKELGNFEAFDGKPVLQNNAEVNFFYDYILFYRTVKGKRYICDWTDRHPEVLNEHNKKVILACNNSRLSVLGLDKNLTDGAIRVTDIIAEKEYLLMDKALNISKKEGYFFVCSLLDMGTYVMTSGIGACIDSTEQRGRAVLTMTAQHMASRKNYIFLFL
jgi:hypothetical protein